VPLQKLDCSRQMSCRATTVKVDGREAKGDAAEQSRERGGELNCRAVAWPHLFCQHARFIDGTAG